MHGNKIALILALLLAGPASAQVGQPPSQSAAFVTVLNNPTVGTTPNTLTSLDTASPSRAIITSAGATSGVIGIATQGTGKANASLIQVLGQSNCIFDNSTTAGDYVQPSSILAGNCHDTGTASNLAAPTGLNVGIVTSTNTGAGTYTVLLASQSLVSSGGSSISVPVTLSNGGTATTYGPAQTFIQLPNANTTQGLLAKLTGAGSVLTALTTDTDGMVGICTSGCGSAGTATLQTAGIVNCSFPAATTANDWVGISSTTAGDCADVGSTRPTSGQSIGRVLSTNAGAGSYQVAMNLNGSGGGGGNPSVGSAGTVQQANGSGAFQAYAGSSCPAGKVAVAIDATGAIAGTCVTLTKSYVDSTIAFTGVDINALSQVTATHLAAALPAGQGGSGLLSPTAHSVLIGEGAGPFNPIGLASDTLLAGVTGADPVAVTIPNCNGSSNALQSNTASPTNPFSCGSIVSAAYANFVNTASTAVTGTCSATSSTKPSRDVVWQVMTNNTTYTTPSAATGCIDGDILEGYFIQADNHAYQVTLADGAGTSHIGTLYTTPTSTNTGQGFFIHFLLEYHSATTQWEVLGQATNPLTPLSIASGGTGCGTTPSFASLPLSPVQGTTCTINNAATCTVGSPVTAGGSLVCQVMWNGSNWVDGGGAAAGGVGTPFQLATSAAMAEAYYGGL